MTMATKIAPIGATQQRPAYITGGRGREKTMVTPKRANNDDDDDLEGKRRLAEFIKEQLDRRGWSLRTFAMYSETSPNTVSRTLNLKGIPGPETLRKWAQTLRDHPVAGQGIIDEQTLLRIAGHLETAPHRLTDGEVVHEARRLDQLPQPYRTMALDAVRTVIDLVYDLRGAVDKPAPLDEDEAIKSLLADYAAAEEQTRKQIEFLERTLSDLQESHPAVYEEYRDRLRQERPGVPQPTAQEQGSSSC